jgi:hypothetical protein
MLSWVRWALGSAPPRLFVDPKRINPEIQAERRRELEGSVGRRRRIMDRMVQGYACPHPSWLQEHPVNARAEDESHLVSTA